VEGAVVGGWCGDLLEGDVPGVPPDGEGEPPPGVRGGDAEGGAGPYGRTRHRGETAHLSVRRCERLGRPGEPVPAGDEVPTDGCALGRHADGQTGGRCGTRHTVELGVVEPEGKRDGLGRPTLSVPLLGEGEWQVVAVDDTD